jgi:hypothetical protein
MISNTKVLRSTKAFDGHGRLEINLDGPASQKIFVAPMRVKQQAVIAGSDERFRRDSWTQ